MNLLRMNELGMSKSVEINSVGFSDWGLGIRKKSVEFWVVLPNSELKTQNLELSPVPGHQSLSQEIDITWLV